MKDIIYCIHFFLMSCTIVADLSPKICNKCFCKPLLFYSNYHVKIHKDLFTDAFKQEVFALRSKLWWQSFTGLIDWNCLVLSFFENIFCPSTRIWCQWFCIHLLYNCGQMKIGICVIDDYFWRKTSIHTTSKLINTNQTNV